MLKWLRRMPFRRELLRLGRRWTRRIGLSTHYRITRNVGSRVPTSSRV